MQFVDYWQTDGEIRYNLRTDNLISYFPEGTGSYMPDEGNGWTGLDACLGVASDVGAASGAVHGAETFVGDFKDWMQDIGKAAEVNPALGVAEMARAPWVGAEAGQDAVQSYKDTEPIAEQRWQEFCGTTDQAVHQINDIFNPPSPPANDGFLVLDTPAPAASWGGFSDTGHSDSSGSGWGGSSWGSAGDSGHSDSGGSSFGVGHDSSTPDSGTGMDSGSVL